MTASKILLLGIKLKPAATRFLTVQSMKVMGSRRGTLKGRKKSTCSS